MSNGHVDEMATTLESETNPQGTECAV